GGRDEGQPQRRPARGRAGRPARDRCPGGARGAGVAGLPARAAALAGVLPPADVPAGQGHAAGRGPAPRRGPGHRARAGDHRRAAPVLDPDAGDLAAAVALRPAPTQAGDAHARAPALPRRLRLPAGAAGRLGRARRGHRVLARGAARPRHGHRPQPGGRGRRGLAPGASPPSAPPRHRDRGMSAPVRACIGLGGNLGDVAAVLRAALAALDALPGTRLLRASGFYRTPAWGVEAQPDFINAVAVLETALAAPVLLEALLRIERAHGRERAADDTRWGPRTLDLDLLLYGDQVIDAPGLVVPHPQMHARAFVLVPLAEVAPDALVPGRGRVDALLAAVDASGIRPA